MIRTASMLAALLAPTAALADPAVRKTGDVVSVVLENDVFAEQSPDKHYSNGFQASYLWGLDEEPAWARRLADLAPPFSQAIDVRFEVGIGQKMFTPADLSRPVPEERDRPYAGLAYATIGMVAESDWSRLDQLQLLIGIVGPSSGADDAQRFVHRLKGAAPPQGWSTQIPDQAVWQVRWARTDVVATRAIGKDLEVELSRQVGLSAGTLMTDASLGASVRFGPALPREYGVARIAPGLPGGGFFEPRRASGWYVFSGAAQRYVAVDVTLDERDALGRRVDKERWVTDVQAGVAVYSGRWRLAYTEVWRSRSFREQTNDWDSFGALSASYLF